MMTKFIPLIALFFIFNGTAQACKQAAVSSSAENFKTVLDKFMGELKGTELSETQLGSIYSKDRLVVVESTNAKGVCSARAYETHTGTDCKVTADQVRLMVKCKG